MHKPRTKCGPGSHNTTLPIPRPQEKGEGEGGRKGEEENMAEKEERKG